MFSFKVQLTKSCRISHAIQRNPEFWYSKKKKCEEIEPTVGMWKRLTGTISELSLRVCPGGFCNRLFSNIPCPGKA